MAAIPKVRFEKPALPTLWVDTFVVINLAKIKRGEALQSIEVQRGRRLKELVFGLVRNGKLLCPQSDQEEEYVGRRLDDDVHSMFASLSLGISFAHRQGIFDEHVFKGMQAFVRKSETIDLPFSTYFHGDPIRRLEEALREHYIVSVGPSKSPEMLTRRANAKASVGTKWELLRQELVSKKQPYENQLEVEQRGYWQGMEENIRKFRRNLIAGTRDFWGFMAATTPLLYRTFWNELRGQPPDWEGVIEFFRSPYFDQLPQPYIESRLAAELLTGNEPITPSDPMDIELLGVGLPVSHFVLTDRRMELRIKKLKLDSFCGAHVYSMSNIDGLFERLEKLA
jgi:hypothetical protein